MAKKAKKMVHASDRLTDLLFQKVGIFVDAENIELSGWKHHDGRTDYKKILDQVGDREILRILYYKPIYKDISQTFQDFWHGLGGEIKRPSKNADPFLIIDAVTMADKLDVVILLGGDRDYMPLIWYLKSRGCRVEIWSWPEATGPEIQEAADFYFPLTKDYVIPETPRENRGGSNTTPNEARSNEARSNEGRVSEGRSIEGRGSRSESRVSEGRSNEDRGSRSESRVNETRSSSSVGRDGESRGSAAKNEGRKDVRTSNIRAGAPQRERMGAGGTPPPRSSGGGGGTQRGAGRSGGAKTGSKKS